MCAPFVSSWRANNIKIYFPKAAAENPKGGSTPVARKHFTPYFRQLDANSSVEIRIAILQEGLFTSFSKPPFPRLSPPTRQWYHRFTRERLCFQIISLRKVFLYQLIFLPKWGFKNVDSPRSLAWWRKHEGNMELNAIKCCCYLFYS